MLFSKLHNLRERDKEYNMDPSAVVEEETQDMLTHFQMTNFRLFQIERLWRRQFQI